MDIKNIDMMLATGKIRVELLEHNLEENKIIVTYREPSNQMLLSSPPRPAPDSIYRVVYGIDGSSLVTLNIQKGVERITPEAREIIYT